MTKRKTRRSGRGPSRGPGGGLLFDGWWHRMSGQGKRRLLTFLVHLALLGLLGGGLVYGFGRMDRYVRGLDRYQGGIEVAVSEPPDSLRPFHRLRQDLYDAINNALVYVSNRTGTPWFDPELAPRIAQAAGANPFVASVVQVDKQLLERPDGEPERFTRRLVVHLKYRRPAAQFHYPRGRPTQCCVVDGQGVVLDMRDAAHKLDCLPMIVNNASAINELQPGRRVEAEDILAGLELARLLSTQPYWPEIHEIDVANFKRRRQIMASELVLVVRSPIPGRPAQRIEWGFRPGSLEAGDNGTRVKLSHLLAIYERNGAHTLWRVDDPGCGPIADIYNDPQRVLYPRPVEFLTGGGPGR